MTTAHLTEVEAGFARVNRENGRSIGHVYSDKFGSSRTGTMWFARSGRTEIQTPYGATRAQAVQALVDHVDAEAAKAAAFLAKYEARS